MSTHLKINSLWLVGVVLWNFGFPGAKPIADVGVALILSIITYQLNRVLK
tara:strand:- start:22 stop:171 length:150 start_codon:yes stop_codon:yes gene_type:complete